MSKVKWIDLRDQSPRVRLKLGSVRSDDGQLRHILFVVGLDASHPKWRPAIDLLGFAPSAKGKYLVRAVSEGERLQARSLHAVWPNAAVSEMLPSDYILDLSSAKSQRVERAAKTEEEASAAMDTGEVHRLGRNVDGNEVFSSALMGRYIQHETGTKVFESMGVAPHLFLRAPNETGIALCADGYIQAMLRGEVQRSEDLAGFMEAIYDRTGPFLAQEYGRVSSEVDAAMVRYLNSTHSTAQDAYGDSTRLFECLPQYAGPKRGAAAMPLPLAVIAQRLLGDTAGQRVAVPNAFDGASFAFMSPGTQIAAFRGSRDLSGLVQSVRSGDVVWKDEFARDADGEYAGIFFNADPAVDDATGSREDYIQAAASLRKLARGGRAVLVLAADGVGSAGELSGESRRFLEALGRRYEIESAVEIGGEICRKTTGAGGLRVISLRNAAPGANPLNLSSIPVVHSWDDLKANVDETIVRIALKEAPTDGIDLAKAAAGNDFQAPYVTFSKVGEARTMVPRNMAAPLQYALASVEEAHGQIDRFVEEELGYGEHTLGDRFSPEQVDAIALSIHRIKGGRGIIIGDETGIGKGRQLAAMATWAQKQGKRVVFVTDRANLFSDFVRDLRDIGEWGRFAPVVTNSGVRLMDIINNEELHPGTPAAEMRSYLERGTKLEEIGKNIVFTTYSQISGEESEKAPWVLEQAEDALVIVDEAHIAAGSNSNTSHVVADLVARSWGTVYSSATWAKSSENLHIYYRALPDGINISTLTQTMRVGGEAFSSVFSSMLARDGAFIRREHDLSKIEFVMEVDGTRTERNNRLSDQLTAVLAAMVFVSGDIDKLLIRANSDSAKTLKMARQAFSSARSAENNERQRVRNRVRQENQGDPAAMRQALAQIRQGNVQMFKSRFGAGSAIYQVMRRFLAVLNADHVADLSLKAHAENMKPVIVFEDTGDTFVQRLIRAATLPGIDGEPEVLPSAIRPPTVRDLLRDIALRIGMISTSALDEADLAGRAEVQEGRAEAEEGGIDLEEALQQQNEDIANGRALQLARLPHVTEADQKNFEKGMASIMTMIEELPPLPLSAVDVVRMRLEAAGLRVGEISGRPVYLEAPEATKQASIEEISDDPWKIVRRDRRKSAVNDTVYRFNSGDLDAVAINRSAATGLGLHASPRFADARRRFLAELQIAENPTDRIQLFGRVNRFDQIVTPKIAVATTGIYGETRQVMMQNKKLARLSANVRSSRDHAAEMKAIPDLLNSVGREVAFEYLREHGAVCTRLGIAQAEAERSGFPAVERLTARAVLLKVNEQRALYDELYSAYADTILRYELAGENPLREAEMDIRAEVVSSKIVMGSREERVGSAFDGPVYQKKLSWEEDRNPVSWAQVTAIVTKARAELVAAGTAHLLDPNSDAAQRMLLAEPSSTTETMADILASQLLSPATAGGADGWLPAPLEIEEYPEGPNGEDAAAVPQEAQLVGAEILSSPLLAEEYADEMDALLGATSDAAVRDDAETAQPTPPEGETADLWGADPFAEVDTHAIFMSRQRDDLFRQRRSDKGAIPRLPGMRLDGPAQQMGPIMEALSAVEMAGAGIARANRAEAIEKNPAGSVAKATYRALWVAKNLHRLVPGAQVTVTNGYETVGRGATSWKRPLKQTHMLVGVHVPPDHQRAQLSRWKFDLLKPGDEKPTQITLARMLRGISGVSDGNGSYMVMTEVEIGDDLYGAHAASVRSKALMASVGFDLRKSGKVKREGMVLDGNMYLASEWARATKHGKAVLYTDNTGARHRAILLKNGGRGALLEHLPLRLHAPDMIRRFVGKLLEQHAAQANEAQARPAATPEAGRRRRSSEFIEIPTTFATATRLSGFVAEDAVQRTLLVIPGQGLAMQIDRTESSRMARSLRAEKLRMVAGLVPGFRRMNKEAQKEAMERYPMVKVSAAKRGSKGPAVVFIDCDPSKPEHNRLAIELLCKGAGIELYVPLASQHSALAEQAMQEYYASRATVASATPAPAELQTGAPVEAAAQPSSSLDPASAVAEPEENNRDIQAGEAMAA